MAKDKKSFKFYVDWIDTFKQMPKEKGYDLLMHLLSFVNDEQPKTDDMLINVVFANMKNTLERDLLLWKQKANSSRENGKLGGRPKKTNELTNNLKEPNKPTRLNNNLTEPKEPVSVTVRVRDTVSVRDSVILNKHENIKFSFVVESFNSICLNSPKVIKTTEKRKKLIKTIFKEFGYEKMGDVFKKVAQSNFLGGGGQTGWVADFDWVMNQNNFIKVLEGKYDKNGSNNSTASQFNANKQAAYNSANELFGE